MTLYRLTRKKVVTYLNRRNRLLKAGDPFKFIKGDLNLISAYLTKANSGSLVPNNQIALSIFHCDKNKLMQYLENFANRLILEYNINMDTTEKMYNGNPAQFITKYY